MSGRVVVVLGPRIDCAGLDLRRMAGTHVVPDLVRHRVPVRNGADQAGVVGAAREAAAARRGVGKAASGRSPGAAVVDQHADHVGRAGRAHLLDGGPPVAVQRGVRIRQGVQDRPEAAAGIAGRGEDADQAEAERGGEPRVGQGRVHLLHAGLGEVRNPAQLRRGIVGGPRVVRDENVDERGAGAPLGGRDRHPRRLRGLRRRRLEGLGAGRARPLAGQGVALRDGDAVRTGRHGVDPAAEIVLHVDLHALRRDRHDGVAGVAVALGRRQERHAAVQGGRALDELHRERHVREQRNPDDVAHGIGIGTRGLGGPQRKLPQDAARGTVRIDRLRGRRA